jgi:patatin-like phospholipase/acyl hydrolase
MPAFRILALDGGGVRGLVTVIALQRLVAVQPQLLAGVHLLAGTSTGGLIALGLGAGATLAELRKLYEVQSAEIFDDSWLDDLVDLSKVAGAEYDNRGLIRHARKLLGEKTLRELNRRVMVTAFDLDNESADPRRRTWKPKVFHNIPGADSDGGELAWKVGIYTSAAPTYFPAYEGYVDGGVFANNPSMCALALALDARANAVRPALDDLRVLSIGTGTALTYIEGRNLDWGLAQWVKPLIDVMMDGVAGIADYQCRQLLGSRYHRLAPAFPPKTNIPLDEVKRIGELVAFAEAIDLAPTLAFLANDWA